MKQNNVLSGIILTLIFVGGAAFAIYYFFFRKPSAEEQLLRSFVLLDDRMKQNIDFCQKSNEYVYSAFERLGKDSLSRRNPYIEKSQKVKQFANEASHYLDSVRAILISKCEGIAFAQADTFPTKLLKLKYSQDSVNKHFIESKLVLQVQKKLSDYRNQLLSLTEQQNNKILKEKLGIHVDSVRLSEKKMVAWSEYFFENNSLIAIIPILSSLQSEVRYAENFTLGDLYYRATQLKK